ncbi:hypothetical protein IKF03_02720 [Candidatus Saccharibacteria bacterium]|nr:hypothetical protein [Candidatus Saccharibacteria bacterium]
MYKDEIPSTEKSENELDPGVQALADLADSMQENNSESEYNEAGFNSKGFHKNGTRYDDDGYGADGFDETGVDREGFDREGFGSDDRDRDGYDREGYNEAGYDRKGFDKSGMHKETGTEYDGNSFWYGHKGYNRDGFDENGYDRKGYDKDGFFRDGFNDEGIHKTTRTEFNPGGWNRAQTIHRDTGDQYGPDGFDHLGYNKDGYDRDGYDRKGWDKDGYDRGGFHKKDLIHRETRTKYGPDGYNMYGLDKNRFDREGFYHPPNKGNAHTRYHNGYDYQGFNRHGYDREGYDKEGYDKEGYDREGLDKDGYTREYNAKFNRYDVDENGYMKNGEIDPDVDFAIDFAKSGIKDQSKYASEKNMDVEDVREKIAMARKKCPNIDEIISDLLLTGNKMRVATILKDCNKCIDGSLDINEFWDKHPRLTVTDILTKIINDPDEKKVFSDRTIEGIVMNSNNIENNLRIFGASQYDVSSAIKGAEDFKKMYAKFGISSPEQAQQKRENTKKIYDMIKYFNRYKNRNLDSLLGSRQSLDGGQTWIEFNGETIGQAMDALKKDKKLICVQSVKDYIINQSRQ